MINLAAFVGGLTAPIAIGFPVTFAVQFAANTATEIQGRYRTNAKLDKISERPFMPRGLYAIINTYKPNKRDQEVLHVDLDKAAAARAKRAEEDKTKRG